MPDCDCVSCCHVQCVFASQHSEPLQEQEPMFPEQTSLTQGKVFVKLVIEGSNATNYLGGISQPSYRFDGWLWPSFGWHVQLLLKGQADESRCGYGEGEAFILYSTSLRQTRTGKLPWWHLSLRPLQNIQLCSLFKTTHIHSDIFPLMIGFITCFLLSLRAQPHSHWAMNSASGDKTRWMWWLTHGSLSEDNNNLTMKLIYSVALIKTNTATASHKTEIKNQITGIKLSKPPF